MGGMRPGVVVVKPGADSGDLYDMGGREVLDLRRGIFACSSVRVPFAGRNRTSARWPRVQSPAAETGVDATLAFEARGGGDDAPYEALLRGSGRRRVRGRIVAGV